MLRIRWVTAAFATAGLLAAGVSARAGDTLRLGLDSRDTPTITLAGPDASDADTFEVGHGAGGHGGGGHGGGHGGSFHGGGFHGSSFHGSNFHGGHFHGNSFHGSHFHANRFNNRFNNGFFRYGYGFRPYYRGWYGYGNGYGYWPYYSGWYGYRPYYRNWWYPYYASLGNYSDAYYYPSTTVIVPPATLSTSPTLQSQSLYDTDIETAPPPTALPPDRTFPYDGGPRNPPPMPRAEPAPIGAPATLPLSGRSVSLPTKSSYTYPAYGETVKHAPAVGDRVNTYLIRSNAPRP